MLYAGGFKHTLANHEVTLTNPKCTCPHYGAAESEQGCHGSSCGKKQLNVCGTLRNAHQKSKASRRRTKKRYHQNQKNLLINILQHNNKQQKNHSSSNNNDIINNRGALLLRHNNYSTVNNIKTIQQRDKRKNRVRVRVARHSK